MGVTVRQKVKGKGQPWWVFIVHNGNRTSRRVGTKDAAVEVATKVQARLQLGEFDFEEEKKEEKRDPTFKEYADSWININAPAECKESTVASYDDLLRIHVLPEFGVLNLKEINRGKIKDFIASKINTGYSASSVTHMRNLISNVLNKAVDDEVIPANPALRLGKIVKKANGDDEGNENERIDPLTREETIPFLSTALTHFKKDYPLTLLLFRTGLRIGEALALKWGDIDFNGRFIHVQRGLSRMKIQTPKSGKTRRIDMSPQLAEVLTAYKTECKKKGMALGLGDAPEYLFTNGNGGFVDVNNWRKTFKKMLKKAKLRKIRIHDARHTYATLRISKGDNIADVSKQLGHYSVRLTMDVYYHWLPGNKKSEVDALDDVIEEQKVAVNEG
ncbi:MAG: site-specific integrase [Thermodesulfobacteriota bacterium]|jgi:integrase